MGLKWSRSTVACTAYNARATLHGFFRGGKKTRISTVAATTRRRASAYYSDQLWCAFVNRRLRCMHVYSTALAICNWLKWRGPQGRFKGGRDDPDGGRGLPFHQLNPAMVGLADWGRRRMSCNNTGSYGSILDRVPRKTCFVLTMQ